MSTKDAAAVVRGTPKAMSSSTVVHCTSIAAVVSNEEGIFVEDFVFLDHHKFMFGYDLKCEAALPTDLNQGGAGTVVCPRHLIS
jgi:hypothetical protein